MYASCIKRQIQKCQTVQIRDEEYGSVSRKGGSACTEKLNIETCSMLLREKGKLTLFWHVFIGVPVPKR